MKHFLIALTMFGFVSYAHAQTSEDSVKAAVNMLFTAMKTSDAQLLKSSFADSAILQTITRSKEGNIVVKNEGVPGFIDVISKLPAGAADERISFGIVKTDGPLAMAWTPYSFYYNGQFSHCGVNSFQLVRLHGEWKIQYIIDTRRKDNCQ